MYVLLGKYESNAIALKLYSDSCRLMIDNYEALVRLLEEQREAGAIMRYVSSFTNII